MNRRHFLTGAGIAGIVGAAIKSVKAAAAPEGSVSACQDGIHEPMETYKIKAGQVAAIAMSDGQGDGLRAMVPCKNCGVLFALCSDENEGGSSIRSTGGALPDDLRTYGGVRVMGPKGD